MKDATKNFNQLTQLNSGFQPVCLDGPQIVWRCITGVWPLILEGDGGALRGALVI